MNRRERPEVTKVVTARAPVVLQPGQVFKETRRAWEIWEADGTRRVHRIPKKSVFWVIFADGGQQQELDWPRVSFGELPDGAAFFWPESKFAGHLVHVKARAGTLGEGDAAFCDYAYWDPAMNAVIGRMDPETPVVVAQWPGPWNTCALCHQTLPAPLTSSYKKKLYDWDNPNEDEQGSVLETRTFHACRDQVACRQRREAHARLEQEAARADDMAAHEDGRGGRIGGGF